MNVTMFVKINNNIAGVLYLFHYLFSQVHLLLSHSTHQQAMGAILSLNIKSNIPLIVTFLKEIPYI